MLSFKQKVSLALFALLPSWAYGRTLDRVLEWTGGIVLLGGAIAASLTAGIMWLFFKPPTWFLIVTLLPSITGLCLLVASMFTNMIRTLRVELLLPQRFDWKAELLKHKRQCPQCGALV